MYDLKNRRTFLKRCDYPAVTSKDLYKGGILTIYSRQLTVKDYGAAAPLPPRRPRLAPPRAMPPHPIPIPPIPTPTPIPIPRPPAPPPLALGPSPLASRPLPLAPPPRPRRARSSSSSPPPA